MKYIDAKVLRHRRLLSIEQQVLFYIHWTRITIKIIFMTLQKKNNIKYFCKRKRVLITLNLCKNAIGDASMN